MEERILEQAMLLIAQAGDARSHYMEALAAGERGDFSEAERLIAEAKEKIVAAHHCQTALIAEEMSGQSIAINLLLVHAQDHLMNTLVIKDLSSSLLTLLKRTGGQE